MKGNKKSIPRRRKGGLDAVCTTKRRQFWGRARLFPPGRARPLKRGGGEKSKNSFSLRRRKKKESKGYGMFLKGGGEKSFFESSACGLCRDGEMLLQVGAINVVERSSVSLTGASS